MYMLMLVLNNPEYLDEVLLAVEAAGVSGSTIIESTGINRRRLQRQVGAPFMAGINRLTGSTEENHFTLFSIVQDEEQVNACIRAVEKVIGNLDDPDTGVAAAWPLSIVKGVKGRLGEE